MSVDGTKLDQPATLGFPSYAHLDERAPAVTGAGSRSTLENAGHPEPEDANGNTPTRFCTCLDSWLPTCIVDFLEMICSWVDSCTQSFNRQAPETPDDLNPLQPAQDHAPKPHARSHIRPLVEEAAPQMPPPQPAAQDLRIDDSFVRSFIAASQQLLPADAPKPRSGLGTAPTPQIDERSGLPIDEPVSEWYYLECVRRREAEKYAQRTYDELLQDQNRRQAMLAKANPNTSLTPPITT